MQPSNVWFPLELEVFALELEVFSSGEVLVVPVLGVVWLVPVVGVCVDDGNVGGVVAGLVPGEACEPELLVMGVAAWLLLELALCAIAPSASARINSRENANVRFIVLFLRQFFWWRALCSAAAFKVRAASCREEVTARFSLRQRRDVRIFDAGSAGWLA
jgi:hypothetical protein